MSLARTKVLLIDLAVVGLLVALPADIAIAQLGDCERIGRHATAHSCGHGVSGPFATLSAAATATSGTRGPERHVYTTVVLPGSGAERTGELTWRYPSGGYHALWTLGDYPIVVRTFDTGELVTEQLAHEVTECPASLTRARVWELEGGVRYRIQIGPTPQAEVVLLAENLDDIASFWWPDSDGDGWGLEVPEPLLTFCEGPDGFVENEVGDCDDTDATVHPSPLGDVPETVCDRRDDDCDEIVDDGFEIGAECVVGVGSCEAIGTTVCSADGMAAACDATAGTSREETCNGLDDDCDSRSDEACVSSDVDAGPDASTGGVEDAGPELERWRDAGRGSPMGGGGGCAVSGHRGAGRAIWLLLIAGGLGCSWRRRRPR